MQRPHEQAAAFIGFLLEHTAVLEFAAGVYSQDTGKVGRVLPARLRVTSMADWSKLEPWLRAQNTRQPANIWVRGGEPAHPIVMLDDLPPIKALTVTQKYRGATVETSPGNCQAVLVLDRPLSREQRQDVVRSLCARIGSDPGSISEPRWFRMPGFRGKKPGKECWTNLLGINATGQCLDPTPHLAQAESAPPVMPPISPRPWGAGGVALPVSHQVNAGDQHKREFAFACHSLRHGVAPDAIADSIAARALARGKRTTPEQAERYARQTVEAAMARLRP